MHDYLDPDRVDEQPQYDGGAGEEIIENPTDVVDSDNLDQTPVDSDSETADGFDKEEVVENFGDDIDVGNIDQKPVYNGQPGEEAIEDPADEMDIDNRDQVEMEDSCN